jgi:hypothetical protein
MKKYQLRPRKLVLRELYIKEKLIRICLMEELLKITTMIMVMIMKLMIMILKKNYINTKRMFSINKMLLACKYIKQHHVRQWLGVIILEEDCLVNHNHSLTIISIILMNIALN